MKRHIHFADVQHMLDKADCIPCTQHIFEVAVMCQLHKDLRFDNVTGVTRDNHLGELSRLSIPSEFLPYNDIGGVLQWEFKSHVNNSISRLQRELAA